MENKTSIIEKLNHEELQELKKLIKEGTIEKEVENKLEKFKYGNSVCPVCNTPITDEGFTLTFGPSDLRKKATFDAADCLEYFLSRIRK